MSSALLVMLAALPVKQVSTYEVSCRQWPTVRFTMPVFEQWEPYAVEDSGATCEVWLRSPPGAKYESQRAVLISKVDEAVPCEGATKNAFGVTGCKAFDASRWVEGYVPKPGQWDVVQLTLGADQFHVVLEADSEARGFSADQAAAMLMATTRKMEAEALDARAAAKRLVPLNEPLRQLPHQRAAAAAVAKSLDAKHGANEFYVGVTERSAKEWTLALWHYTRLKKEHDGARGDPTGLCRDVTIDPKSLEVLGTVFIK